MGWNNPEARKIYYKKWYLEHKEEQKSYMQAYHKEHKKEVYARVLRWRKNNPQKTKEQGKRYYKKYTEKKNQKNRKNTINLKKEILSFYGKGKLECVLCGFNNIDALTIDHINGNGRKHSQELGGGGMKVYLWLKRNNYPEGFRTLCANCQLIEYAKKRRIFLNETPEFPGNNNTPNEGGLT